MTRPPRKLGSGIRLEQHIGPLVEVRPVLLVDVEQPTDGCERYRRRKLFDQVDLFAAAQPLDECADMVPGEFVEPGFETAHGPRGEPPHGDRPKVQVFGTVLVHHVGRLVWVPTMTLCVALMEAVERFEAFGRIHAQDGPTVDEHFGMAVHGVDIGVARHRPKRGRGIGLMPEDGGLFAQRRPTVPWVTIAFVTLDISEVDAGLTRVSESMTAMDER